MKSNSGVEPGGFRNALNFYFFAADAVHNPLDSRHELLSFTATTLLRNNSDVVLSQISHRRVSC